MSVLQGRGAYAEDGEDTLGLHVHRVPCVHHTVCQYRTTHHSLVAPDPVSVPPAMPVPCIAQLAAPYAMPVPGSEGA
eukprot:3860318-Rhodomonas_salina.1